MRKRKFVKKLERGSRDCSQVLIVAFKMELIETAPPMFAVQKCKKYIYISFEGIGNYESTNYETCIIEQGYKAHPVRYAKKVSSNNK